MQVIKFEMKSISNNKHNKQQMCKMQNAKCKIQNAKCKNNVRIQGKHDAWPTSF